MKIDGSILPTYTLSKPRASSDDSLYSSTGGGGGSSSSRNIPTVSPTAPISSSFAAALWMTQAKLEEPADSGTSLVDEFMELSKMSAVERLRKELLESMGLTEESLAALPPEQRKAIEEEITRAIKEQLGIDGTSQAGAAEGQPVAGMEEAGA